MTEVLQPLTSVAVGQAATVAEIKLPPASRPRLMEMGLLVGTRVAIVSAPRSRIPLGAGVFDPAVYPQAEAAMKMELARFALTENR